MAPLSPGDELRAASKVLVRVERLPGGKRSVAYILPCENQEWFAGKFIALMGEPSQACHIAEEGDTEDLDLDEYPRPYVMIWDHQDFPDALREAVDAQEEDVALDKKLDAMWGEATEGE